MKTLRKIILSQRKNFLYLLTKKKREKEKNYKLSEKKQIFDQKKNFLYLYIYPKINEFLKEKTKIRTP